MEKENNREIMLVNEELLQDKIYIVRGQKVMLDVDLAEIYGYETKNFNRQVKNNIEKFEGEDFMFQMSETEWKNLRCKNFTSSWGGARHLPHVFTEQGIYMLMTVLRGDLAIQQSRALIRTFKKHPNLNIKLHASGGIFHDRYIILDYDTENEKVFHCGAFSKDAGRMIFAINEIENISMIHPIIDKLLLGVE